MRNCVYCNDDNPNCYCAIYGFELMRKTSDMPIDGYYWDSDFACWAEGDELFKARMLATLK